MIDTNLTDWHPHSPVFIARKAFGYANFVASFRD